jgi:CRISPR-associated protein Csd1
LCEFGVAGSGSSETKQLLKNRYMHDLIISRIEKNKIPMRIVNELFEKCNNLCIVEQEEEKKKAKDHSEKGTYSKAKLLFTVCAVIRKYYYDYFKEEFAMELEEERKDRSYQYGRLLAILEKAEKDTYGNDMNRMTNAIRMQSAFSKNPASVAKVLIEQVKGSYYPKLKPPARTFYDKQIGQIFEMISSVDSDMSNKALNESYILGYYLQKNELYKKHVEEENANE